MAMMICCRGGNWRMIVILGTVLVVLVLVAVRVITKEEHTLMATGLTGMIVTHSKKSPVIAYAVTITHCGKEEDENDDVNVKPGLWDPAAVLAHSIHLVHTTQPTNYPHYKLYAFVHTNATQCGMLLEELGYTVQVLPNPVELSEMRSILPQYIVRNDCCGMEKEFMKLYVLHLIQHPVAISLDLDTLLLHPMDELFDVIINGTATAIFTRDYALATGPPHVTLKSRVGMQGGFFMAQPNLTVLEEMKEIIRDGANYTEGFSWGGPSLGHSWYYGVHTVQGFISYYYGYRSTTPFREWNRCTVNYMGDGPNRRVCPLAHNMSVKAEFRERASTFDCQDCENDYTIDQMMSAHFTACQKPWNCRTSKPICLQFHYEWHRIRHHYNVHVLGHTTAANSTTAQQQPAVALENVTKYRDIEATFPMQCLNGEYIPLITRTGIMARTTTKQKQAKNNLQIRR